MKNVIILRQGKDIFANKYRRYLENEQKINNRLADAFYDEDWKAIAKIIGKEPKNHLEAERLIEAWKKKVI